MPTCFSRETPAAHSEFWVPKGWTPKGQGKERTAEQPGAPQNPQVRLVVVCDPAPNKFSNSV